MVYMDNDDKQSKLVVQSFDFGIPRDHEVRLIKDFVNENYGYLDDECAKKRGRPAFPKTALLAVMIYADYDDVNSCRKVSEYCDANKYYNYLTGGLIPSERTLQRFEEEHGNVYNDCMKQIPLEAQKEGFTNFNTVEIDGTIAKANNSPYNVIKQDDIEKLIEILKNEYTTDEIIDRGIELRRPAYKLLTNEKVSDYEKLEKLYKLQVQLRESGQNSIGLTDPESRWMINKKGKPELAYNIQSSVDYDSKMIVSIDVTQDPTDHYQLEKQLDNIENNLKQKPENIGADNGYRTRESMIALQNKKINGYLPTRKQTRKAQHKLNKNPYHKDHFIYHWKTDSFTCPENEELPFQNELLEKNKKPGHPNKIKRVYYNNKCSKCYKKDSCTKSTTRVITEYGGALEKAMEQKMETKEAQEEYKKRGSTVEAPFGTLRTQKQIDNTHINGIQKTQNRMARHATAYNLKRWINLRKKQNEDKKILQKFINQIIRKSYDTKFTITIK